MCQAVTMDAVINLCNSDEIFLTLKDVRLGLVKLVGVLAYRLTSLIMTHFDVSIVKSRNDPIIKTMNASFDIQRFHVSIIRPFACTPTLSMHNCQS